MYRRNISILCVIMFCIQFIGCVHLSSAEALDKVRNVSNNLVETASDLRGLIVQVEVPTKDVGASRGSGFWLTDTGYIGTCWHVVAGNPTSNITIKSATESYFDLKRNVSVYSNWSVFSARVVAKDEVNDVALLKVTVSPFKAQKNGVIKFGDKEIAASYRHSPLATELPKAGEIILLAGYPLGNPFPIVQQGTVASIAKNLTDFGDTVKILLSLVANPGNSGGPVVDSQGNVIGILEGGLPSRPGQDPAQAQSGIAVVVPSFFLFKLLESVER